MRKLPLVAMGLLGLSACTCPPGKPPADAHEALRRVNDNLSGLDNVLYSAAFVSFKYRDDEGKRRSLPLSDAAIYFRQPRDLLFQIKSLAGVLAEVGSNRERYWAWIDDGRLWFGDWRNVGAAPARRLPLSPNEVLAALSLQPLPKRLEGGLAPMLRIEGNDHRLLFVRLTPQGQAAGWREVRLQTREPYQPEEVVDWLPDGRVLMHATLGNYRRVGDDGPFTPRHYVVRWPLDDAELRIDITRSRFRPDLDEAEIFEFPEGWQGEIERLDAPLGPAASDAASRVGQRS